MQGCVHVCPCESTKQGIQGCVCPGGGGVGLPNRECRDVNVLGGGGVCRPTKQDM